MVTLPKFGFILDDKPAARLFLEDTVERLNGGDVKLNPYWSTLESYKKGKKIYTSISLDSIYPNIENLAVFSFLAMIAILVFSFPKWLLIVFGAVTLLFSFIKYAKTARFTFGVMSKSLKSKYEYKGRVEFVKYKTVEGWNFDTKRYIRLFKKTET